MLWQRSGIATAFEQTVHRRCFGSTRRDSKYLPRNRFYPWYFSQQLLVVVIGFAGDGSEVPDESNGG